MLGITRAAYSIILQIMRRYDWSICYKLISGKYDKQSSLIKSKSNEIAERSSSRRNSQQLYIQRARLDIRKYSFGVRTAQIWNSLPDEVITATSLNSFKNKLDKLWKNQDILYNYKEKLKTGTNVINNEEESSIEDPLEPALENNDNLT